MGQNSLIGLWPNYLKRRPVARIAKGGRVERKLEMT
jgi:hypothetical protein